MKERRGTKLGLAALGTAVGISVLWFAVNRQVGIPEDRTLFVIGFLVAVALGVAAFVRGTKWYGGLAAVFAILIGIFLPFTMSISRQDVAASVIQVGDTIPRFTAVDEFGKRFDSESLQGHLVLIKFFRAHWCPYCVAELRRWENELRPELDKREVQIVTVSTDSVEELQNRRAAHGLQATMLSDFDLKVTDAFGLRNTLFHSAPPGDEQEALPVPASLLVDRDGKVLWIDLAENYQNRTSTDVVLGAVQKHLD